MSFQIIHLADVAPTPWANGGGTTRVLLAWPVADDWSVRLSVAEVERAGPFSRLPGVRRWFAVLEGDGVRLHVDGSMQDLTQQSDPFEFDGGAHCDCELLGGATRDFNLMLRSGSATVKRVRGVHESEAKPKAMLAVYARQSATWHFGDEQMTVPPDSLAWRILDSKSPIRVTGDDALWMEISP